MRKWDEAGMTEIQKLMCRGKEAGGTALGEKCMQDQEGTEVSRSGQLRVVELEAHPP